MSQHKEFEKLEKVYEKYRLDYFIMAVSHLLDRGFRTVLEMTDEEIEAMKYEPQTKEGVIDLMTEDFIKWIWRTAKEIAVASDKQPVNLITFCQSIDLFDTNHFDGKPNKTRMEEMLNSRIENERYGFNDKDDVEKLCELYDCEEKDFKALGYQMEYNKGHSCAEN